MVVDVAIIGAGIAGLWLANLLAERGFAVALCDGNPVGGTQTVASQGIVHSGVKYGWPPAGFGRLVRRTALATMPARWRACLAGRGEVDLRGVDVAAEHMHLFGRGVAAKAKVALAGLILAGGAKRVDAAVPPFGPGLLLELADFALDVPSLIRCLAAPVRHRLLAADVVPGDLALGPAGVKEVRVQGRALCASAYVFAAGVGNAALAQRIGARAATMRRRPLRQAWVRLPGTPPCVFAHVVSGAFGGAPALTITSHAGGLYIGGHVAEVGATGGAAAHLARLRRLLTEHLPALDLTGAEFETFRIDRAEPDGPAGGGDAFVARHGNCLVCWPVKLSLAPRLGDKVLDALRHLRPIAAAWPGDADTPLAYAAPPWAMAHADGEAGRCQSGRRSGT